jgi:hypothetical protein
MGDVLIVVSEKSVMWDAYIQVNKFPIPEERG